MVNGTRLSTTMGLKYPLKKFDSQWPFPMGILNDFITIFGKDCHIWNNAQARSLYVKLPRLFTVYLSMGRGRNRFLNLCARV